MRTGIRQDVSFPSSLSLCVCVSFLSSFPAMEALYVEREGIEGKSHLMSLPPCTYVLHVKVCSPAAGSNGDEC